MNTRIVIASDVIDLPEDRQLYTLVFTYENDEMNSLIHFTSEDVLNDYCKRYNVDYVAVYCDYNAEAMDWDTGTTVFYDQHIYHAVMEG